MGKKTFGSAGWQGFIEHAYLQKTAWTFLLLNNFGAIRLNQPVVIGRMS